MALAQTFLHSLFKLPHLYDRVFITVVSYSTLNLRGFFIFYLNETNEGRIHQHSPYLENNNALEARTGLPSSVFPTNRPSVASL